ncbi:hypothetical protein ACWEKR_35250, partial [Nocardia sp. NPDC004573]
MTGLVEAETGLRIDPTERIDLLLRDLRGSRSGLTTIAFDEAAFRGVELVAVHTWSGFLRFESSDQM